MYQKPSASIARPVAVHPDAGQPRPVGLQVALAGSRQKPRVMPGQGWRIDQLAHLAAHRIALPSSTTSAAMPGTGALKAQGLSGSRGLQPRMPPRISVPPE